MISAASSITGSPTLSAISGVIYDLVAPVSKSSLQNKGGGIGCPFALRTSSAAVGNAMSTVRIGSYANRPRDQIEFDS